MQKQQPVPPPPLQERLSPLAVKKLNYAILRDDDNRPEPGAFQYVATDAIGSGRYDNQDDDSLVYMVSALSLITYKLGRDFRARRWDALLFSLRK